MYTMRTWSIAGLSILIGCAETAGLPRGVYPSFQEYKSTPLHRAFAMVKSGNGSYSASWVYSRSSAEKATADALANCKAYSKKYDYVNPDRCFVYAVDDEIKALVLKKNRSCRVVALKDIDSLGPAK